MDDKQFLILTKNLEVITKLLGTQIIKDMEFREQVLLLSSVGMRFKEIAELTGKTENNVKVTLHLIKKAKKDGGKG